MKATNIKTSWKDVSINEFFDLKNRIKEIQTPYEKEIYVLSFVYNISEDDVYNKTIPEIKQMQKNVQWMSQFDIPQNIKFKKIKINNNKYIVHTDLQKFSMGQYIDFQTFYPKKDDEQNYIGNLLACFLIPKGHKYNTDYDIQEVIDDINATLDIQTAYEIIFFFLKQYLISIKALLTYFNYQIKILKMMPMKNKEKIEKLQKVWNQTQKNISDGFLSSITYQN